MTARCFVLATCFMATMGLSVRAMRPEVVPLREPLSQVPLALGAWRGQDHAPFADNIVAVLGVDEYVSRVYRTSAGDVASLYVGYYESQRQGDTIHSPMNCLPGAGWQPIETGTETVAVPGNSPPITVNRVVIQKGLDRQVALYWYQSHGRVVANEYKSKALMVYDAVRLNRSDAALVRVISPVAASDEGTAEATRRAVDFVTSLWPSLERHLPS